MIFYVCCCILTFFVGVIGLLVFSEYGRDDIDVKCAIVFIKFALIFPFAWYKAITMRLDNADGEDSK